MSFFIGNCEAKTDAKGRVFLPSVYRRLLPDGERGRVVMRMDPENECLVLYPEGVWNRMVEELQGRLDEWDAEDRLLLMQFVSDAEWMDIDSQGRILIQKRFLSAIGAGQTLLFVGMIDRIAVWGKERYESAKMGREDFARRLFRRSILNADYYRHLISENARNWDLNRVAVMDAVIMQIALAEILSFPNIPVSVSLNEYVEIAKLYSTPKSGAFINGTLDGIVNQLKKDNKLTKN